MKNESNGEKILIACAVIVILFVIFYIIYTVFNSNSGFYSNNSTDMQNTQNNENTNSNNDKNVDNTDNADDSSNSSSISDQDIDDMNVDSNLVKPKEVETEIANFNTTIYDKDENRVYNIGLAIQKLNNYIIKKGEEFSFNGVVGPMGEEQGYKQAVGFDSNGNKIKVFGGGMCQISSTLYNAALIANLEITERHPHSRRVYYVPKDKDATVYYNTLDLKFKNNTENDIKILATNDNVNVTIKLNKIERDSTT